MTMRHEVARMFKSFLTSQRKSIQTVAIIGGSSLDPEVRIIELLYPDSQIFFFDIENANEDSNFIFLDINESPSPGNFKESFDLIVSSQVLEHIWNHRNYFELFRTLTHEGSLVWINCPRSNLEHGSPHYYAAGFTASYLSKNLGLRGFLELESGEIGNKRYYLAVHFARYWQTPEENAHPVFNYNFQPGTTLGVLRKFLVELPSRLFLAFIPKAHSIDSQWATESYVGCVKSG